MYVYNLYLYSSLHSEQECDVYSKYNDVKKKRKMRSGVCLKWVFTGAEWDK